VQSGRSSDTCSKRSLTIVDPEEALWRFKLRYLPAIVIKALPHGFGRAEFCADIEDVRQHLAVYRRDQQRTPGISTMKASISS
jgi:hypothetical protein